MIRRTNDFIKVTNVKVFAYHGVLPEEQKNGQEFFLNAKVYVNTKKASQTDALEHTVNYDEMTSIMHDSFRENVYQLIEAAGEHVIQSVMHYYPNIEAMELEVRKPNAPVRLQPEDVSVTLYREWHRVYVSFGSNYENDEVGYINDTYEILKANDFFRGIKPSELVRTKPYGPVAQADFVNGCFEMDTLFEPEELMEYFRGIEDGFERDRSIKWGPRPIDLDVLFYDDIVYHSNIVNIPHMDMQNRMFVLLPLSELCPGMRHPLIGKTVVQMKAELEEKGGMEDILGEVDWVIWS